MTANKPLTAQQEWEKSKKAGESNLPIDKLMAMIGLEGVKREFLQLKALVTLATYQKRDLKKERQVNRNPPVFLVIQLKSHPF